MYPVLTGCVYLRKLENRVAVYDWFVWLDRCTIERSLLSVHAVFNTENTDNRILFDNEYTHRIICVDAHVSKVAHLSIGLQPGACRCMPYQCCTNV